jgi:hypothetical protein
LATSRNGAPTVIVGDISGGSVVRKNPGTTGCVNQYYAVSLIIVHVGAGGAGAGDGAFTGTLTHLRRTVLGTCVTYSATIGGGLTLSI